MYVHTEHTAPAYPLRSATPNAGAAAEQIMPSLAQPHIEDYCCAVCVSASMCLLSTICSPDTSGIDLCAGTLCWTVHINILASLIPARAFAVVICVPLLVSAMRAYYAVAGVGVFSYEITCRARQRRCAWINTHHTHTRTNQLNTVDARARAHKR